MALFKKLLALLLVSAFATCMGFADAAALVKSSAVLSELPTDSDYDGIPDAYDSAPYDNTFTGRFKSGHSGTTAFGFTMDLRCFFGDNTVYSPELGTVSVVGSTLAYLVPGYGDAYFVFDTAQGWAGGSAEKVDGAELLQVLGFEDVVDYTLDHYGDDDICEVLIGHQTVEYNGETKVVLALWVRGTQYSSEEEWSGDFNVGDLARFFDAYDSEEGKPNRMSNDDWTRKTNHRSFDVCATRLLNYLKTYYLDEYVQPVLDSIPGSSLAYWLTGHSRGGAVAGIMAAYLIDEGCEVFAYTYACPNNTANTEASAEKYDCIFNLVNSNDFIPNMPMTEWGFTRYGRTAVVDASQYSALIKELTGETYEGKYLTESDMNTIISKFVCITGENSDRNDPGRILGWREVYVYHCGHDHAGETMGDHQSTTFCPKQSLTNWGGPSESSYNGYASRLRKYSYWQDGICETPAYCMQVLVELMVKVAVGETISGASTYITANKLADKFDFDKWSLVSYANKLTEPHFMDAYSVIQTQINLHDDPGSLFRTLRYYTAEDAEGGRPAHTHTYTYVPYEGHEPTCGLPGLGYRYCLCSEHNADYYDDYQKNVVIPPLGHAWGEAYYVWESDFSACTAERVCLNDPSHIETETVAAAYEIVTEPTQTSVGIGRYTAVFTTEGFETQTCEVELPMLGLQLGDVDCSGAISFADVTLLYQYVLGAAELTPQGLVNADVDGSGTVNFADVSELYQLIFIG